MSEGNNAAQVVPVVRMLVQSFPACSGWLRVAGTVPRAAPEPHEWMLIETCTILTYFHIDLDVENFLEFFGWQMSHSVKRCQKHHLQKSSCRMTSELVDSYTHLTYDLSHFGITARIWETTLKTDLRGALALILELGVCLSWVCTISGGFPDTRSGSRRRFQDRFQNACQAGHLDLPHWVSFVYW